MKKVIKQGLMRHLSAVFYRLGSVPPADQLEIESIVNYSYINYSQERIIRVKVLIVDDEAKARDLLRFLLRTHVPEVKEIRMADGADSADEVLKTFAPTLVFLDIKMPGRDGFTWLKNLSSKSFSVIFTTAHDQFAIRAIRFSAFDYILKPIDQEDLRKAFDRFIHEPPRHATYENLLHNAKQVNHQDYRLTISTSEGIHYLKPSDIIRCEGDGNYTSFHTESEKKVLASKPLGVFEELLDPMGFIRCHKSHLVNAAFVQKYSDQGLTLTTGLIIEISRRRRKKVKESLRRNLELPHDR